MSKPDHAQHTLLFLQVLSRLSVNKWKSIEDISDHLLLDGITVERQTLQRAMKKLREFPEFGVLCDQRSRMFFYKLDQSSPFSSVSVNTTTSLMLEMVQKHLRYQLPKSLQDALSPFFEAGQKRLDKSDSNAKSWINKVAVVPNSLPSIPPEIKERVFADVSDALYRNVVLDLIYAKSTFEDRPPENYRVEPLGIVQQDVRVYLVARVIHKNVIRHFALHRIVRANVTDLSFNPPADFTLARYIKDRHFNYTPEPVRKIRLSFDFSNRQSYRNLMESPLNETQVITFSEKDMRFSLSVILPDSMLIDAWLKIWKKPAGIVNISKIYLE